MSRLKYLAALEKLYEKGTNPKLGLDRMVKLLELIGFQRSSFLMVQVVGTNGKGSTVAFLESLLLKNGISVGLFSSPHLSFVRERIRINGHMISEEDFLSAAQMLGDAEGLLEPSFFESILAMALWLFQKQQLEVVILEAGLGGRLDATTATAPDILGVSSIDLDHQQILGSSIALITQEKIKAARLGQTVVSVLQNPESHQALLVAQKDMGFNLIQAESCKKPLGLFGDHQQLNAGLALALQAVLKLKTCEQKNHEALLSVNWPGRFEIIEDQVPIVLDGAHNPAGMKALVAALLKHPKTQGQPLVVIYGSMASDNAAEKVEILLKANPKAVIFHEPKNPRALKICDFEKLFSGYAGAQYSFQSLEHAILLAQQHQAILLISGSLYTVGELRAELLSLDMDEQLPNF